MNTITLPDALLFTAPGCAHCAAVKRSLETLAREGVIATLKVVDATADPAMAEQYEVRSVPWLRLGLFTLTGEHSLSELRQWADWASGEEGTMHYVSHLLQQGGYAQARAFIAADTHRLKPLLGIVADPAANLEVRLGVSALLESYAATAALQQLLPQLGDLSEHEDHRVRADACHLLGLTGSTGACVFLKPRLEDVNDEVREIAREALTADNGPRC